MSVVDRERICFKFALHLNLGFVQYFLHGRL